MCKDKTSQKLVSRKKFLFLLSVVLFAAIFNLGKVYYEDGEISNEKLIAGLFAFVAGTLIVIFLTKHANK